MSSYFDKIDKDIQELPKEGFIENLEEIESQMVHDVLLVISDQEFPDDLRQHIQGLIAMCATITFDMEVLQHERSRISQELHSAFHVVAQRQIQTRFGILSDSPTQNLLLQNEHDDGGE